MGDGTMSGAPLTKVSWPATPTALWDNRSTGDPIILGFSDMCKTDVHLEETCLRLLQRYAEQKKTDQCHCSVVGSLSVEPDEGRLVLSVERVVGAECSDLGVDSTQGEVLIPCTVNVNSARPLPTEHDFSSSIQALHQSSKTLTKLNLSQFVAAHLLCSYHCNRATFTFHVTVNLVTFSEPITLTPINPVPIVPTALSKNLLGPMGLANSPADPKSGFLAMDQTRRLLLVLESDPKCASLPLVGIWVGCVHSVEDPRVWVSCLRYASSTKLRDRLREPPKPFLVLVYTTESTRPLFYQCHMTSPDLSPCLLTGHEVIQLHKGTMGELPDGVDVEMLPVQSTEIEETFTSALHTCKTSGRLEQSPTRRDSSTPESAIEDTMPRTRPEPHKYKMPAPYQSSVPDVSLFLEETGPVQQSVPLSDAYTLHNSAPTKKFQQSPPHQQGYAPQPSIPEYSTMSHVISPSSKPYGIPQPSPVQIGIPQPSPVQNGILQPSPLQNGIPQPSPLQNGIPQPSPLQNGIPQPSPAQNGIPQQSPVPQYMTQPSPVPYYVQQPSSVPHGVPQPSPVPYGIPQPSSVPQHSSVPHGMPQYSSTPHGPQHPPSVHPSHPPVHSSRPPWHMTPIRPHQNPSVPARRATVPQHRANPARRPPTKPTSSAEASHSYTPAMYQSQPMRQQVQPDFPDYPAQPGVAPNQPDHLHHTAQVQQASKTQHQPVMRKNEPVTQTAFKTDNAQCPQSQYNIVASPRQSKGSPTNSGANSTEHSPARNSGSTDSGLQVEALNDSSDSLSTSVSQLPADVYQLLKTQDMQLQELRQQLAQLLAKQSSSEPVAVTKQLCDNATQSSGTLTPGEDVKSRTQELDKKCSVAINTSLWLSQPPTRESSQCTDITQQASNTDSYKRQKPRPVFESSPRLSSRENMTMNESLSLGELHLTSVQEPTEESFVSEMMVDMPAYTSMSPDKLGRRSWGSSHCSTDSSAHSLSTGQQPSDDDNYDVVPSEDDQTHMDQRQFYENLIGNVKRFLGQHNQTTSSEETSVVAENTLDVDVSGGQGSAPPSPAGHTHQPQHEASVDVAQMTRQQLCKMGIRLDSILNNSSSRMCDQSTMLLDPAMLPRLNYQSLWLDGGQSDCSSDFDALAMKYLSDEQLSELARIQMSPDKSRMRKSDKLEGVLEHSSTDNSTWGGPANHMSFASKKYLERYGLLENAKDAAPSSRGDHTPGSTEPNQQIHQFLKVLAENNNMSLAEPSKDELKRTQSDSGMAQHCTSFLHGSDHSVNYHQTSPHNTNPAYRNISSVSDSAAHQRQTANVDPTSSQRNYTPRQYQTASHDEARVPSNDRVLDVERLRELPKLL